LEIRDTGFRKQKNAPANTAQTFVLNQIRLMQTFDSKYFAAKKIDSWRFLWYWAGRNRDDSGANFMDSAYLRTKLEEFDYEWIGIRSTNATSLWYQPPPSSSYSR